MVLVMNPKASSLTDFYNMTDLSNKSLLLHSSSGDLSACLQHYVAHRSASTSACIVMPKWNGLWRKYLCSMHLLKDCLDGNAMYVPAADLHCSACPLQVYYDPVHVLESICNGIGRSGLTMHSQGTVSNAAANVFLDSCCSHTLMSASFAGHMGFTVTPVNNPLQVEVASGTVCTSLGTCKVRLELQQFSANVTFSVVELAKQYDVILGEDWLSHHAATMSWEHQCCVVSKGGRKFTIVQSSPGNVAQQDTVPSPKPLSAMQARRAIGHGCRCFVAVCTDAQAGAHCAAAVDSSAEAACTNAHLVSESSLNALLDEYADRFPDELPVGLPPELFLVIPYLWNLVLNLSFALHIG